MLSIGDSVRPIPLERSGAAGHVPYDNNVKQASALAPSLLLGQGVVAQVDSAFVISEVSQGGLTWKIQGDGQVVRVIASGEVTIKGTGAADASDISVTVGGKTEPATVTMPGGKWEKTVTIRGPATQQIVVKKVASEVTRSIDIIGPTQDDGQLLMPVFTAVSNNAYKKPGALKEVRVYGGYLKMSGLRVRNGTRLQFAVFKESGEFLTIAVPSRPIVPGQDASWDGELDLRLPRGMEAGPTAKGFVLALAFSADGGIHRYSDPSLAERVNFQVAPEQTKLSISAAPVLKKPDNSANLPKLDADYLSKEKRFLVTGTISEIDAELREDSRIVVYLNNAPVDVRDIHINGNNEWSATVETDAEIKYSVEAATVLGRNIFSDERSPAATLRVRSTGPRVVAVDPLNAALEGIKITFDEPIKVPDTANLVKSTFVLLNSGKQPKDPETTAALLPRLDPSDNSVTLTYKDVTPDVYTFTVKAGSIEDLFGNKMATDHTEQLFRPIGAEEPAISRGITGPTGPYVPFPEYTQPRPIIDGFNPSDHVETRVARLYYYRDAHRVAQIINREVKSYNRTAVAMQRQLADKSRQIADQATDDRRAKERNAVRAAQKTREAERALQQAEQTAQSAAAQAAGATADLQRKEDALGRLPQDDTTDDRRAQLEQEVNHLRNVVGSLEAVAATARDRAQQEFSKVQQFREEEAQYQEQWEASIAVEDRTREEQFRREVAAANADPDTYAPGQPDSQDPVRQVSVSVIGEGLIQLRGPIKGINIIRTMINQIDAPVGQVRVGVHTVQINGEKGDRMEKVAGKIQRFIDHSRFLTLQSAEMLRKAIVQVAAQKAMELGGMSGMTQEERDRKYLYSFFGEDFIRELEVMDSEFLHTGNKLLSIHSMDSTSLASAMLITALAKNTTRLEILHVFEGMMMGDLPTAEQNYFEAGLTCDGKEKLFTRHCKPNEFQLLSRNARFQSIRGLFDAELVAADTMSPIQREFVRLAQIFKSRLIVEMELKQRIIERSVIEERLGDHLKELEEAKELERQATEKLRTSQNTVKDAQRQVLVAAQPIQSIAFSLQKQVVTARQTAELATQFIQDLLDGYLTAVTNETEALRSEGLDFKSIEPDLRSQAIANKNARNVYLNALKEIPASLESIRNDLLKPLSQGLPTVGERLEKARKDYLTALHKYHPDIEFLPNASGNLMLPPAGKMTFMVPGLGENVLLTMVDGKTTIKPGLGAMKSRLEEYVRNGDEIGKTLAQFEYGRVNKMRLDSAERILKELTAKPIDQQSDDELIDNLHRCMTMFELYSHLAREVSDEASSTVRQLNAVVAGIGADGANFEEVYREWRSVEETINRSIGPNLKARTQSSFKTASDGFEDLLAANLDYQFAARDAENARRPLDHKKFLDMLVDEMEDKYIELLEGTRAHTANIDAYIKRLMTSLDDDFNTQFYYPTFRKVREASQMWDVQMGQVETTNVLANNRSFAKVSPQATMEFDLPKRDILIAEAMDGAKAMIDDVGALAQDPTFLALAKMGSGGSTASQMNGASGGQSTVRNVLPGLSTDTAESVLGQQGPGGAQFGAALEGLIPDPAIYKFETGTGWEIRPVIQPDGQAVVFDFDYMYTTNIREPVRADEKHLGRVKRHFVNTDVQLSNYELREISRYTVALKASRTSRGVPLFEDIPVVGVLFRPLPSDESSLQQNIILGQATIFPTLFDLMGLRWAPVVADLDPLRLSNDEFIVRNRRRALMNRVFDHSSSEVDKFLRIPEAERRMDLYRSQETIPAQHPNGYFGPGANLRDSHLQEGYSPTDRLPSQYVPGSSKEGSPLLPRRSIMGPTLHGPEPEVIPHVAPDEPTSMRYVPATRADMRAHVQQQRFAQRWTHDGNVHTFPSSPPPTIPPPDGSIMRLPSD